MNTSVRPPRVGVKKRYLRAHEHLKVRDSGGVGIPAQPLAQTQMKGVSHSLSRCVRSFVLLGRLYIQGVRSVALLLIFRVFLSFSDNVCLSMLGIGLSLLVTVQNAAASWVKAIFCPRRSTVEPGRGRSHTCDTFSVDVVICRTTTMTGSKSHDKRIQKESKNTIGFYPMK